MSFELGLAIAFVVLIGNAFFVGAEFALVSARRSSIELKALNGSRTAKITLKAMEQVSLNLAGAQLGITLCSLIFGAVGEPVVAHALENPLHALGVSDALLHPIAFAIALTVMVYLHVVIGEMVPKNLALATSTKAALILVPPLYFIVTLSKPLIVSLNAIANFLISRVLGIEVRNEIKSSFSRDEVAGFVKESHSKGLLSKEEENLLSGTLDFEERTIKHVTLETDKVVMTSNDPTPAEIEALSARTGFSRFPVPKARGGLKGYVHLKDIIQLPESGYDLPISSDLIRPLVSVRPGSSLRSTLASMQRTSSHIVQVADKRGKLVGFAMLEDVLEELVGPILDDTSKDTDTATT